MLTAAVAISRAFYRAGREEREEWFAPRRTIHGICTGMFTTVEKV
jgi:hypothetical protein